MMKKFLLFVLVVSILVTFVGCGADKKQQNEVETTSQLSTSKDEEKTTSPSEEKGTIEIMWQQEVTEKFWDYPLEQFKAKYPNVEVKFDSNPKASEAIRNRLSSGDVPDIFYTWSSEIDYFGIIKENLLYSVDELLNEKTFENDTTINERLFKPGVDLGAVDGKHYLLPVSKLLACNFYSGKFFKENNLTAPKTWDEFLKLAAAIKKLDKVNPLIYAGTYPFMFGDAFIFPSINNLDAKAVEAINNNDPGAWKNPAVLTVMKRIQDMRDKGFIDKNSLAMDHIQSQIEFINNKAAIVPTGTWVEGEMEDQWPQGFDLQPLLAPTETDGKASVVSIIESMVLPKKEDTKNLKYVTELVKLFYSNENVARCVKNTGFLIGVQAQDEGIMKLLPKSAQTAWALAADSNVALVNPAFKLKYKDLLTEYNNNINALVSSQINAEQFCDNLDKKAKEISK